MYVDELVVGIVVGVAIVDILVLVASERLDRGVEFTGELLGDGEVVGFAVELDANRVVNTIGMESLY